VEKNQFFTHKIISPISTVSLIDRSSKSIIIQDQYSKYKLMIKKDNYTVSHDK